MGYLTFTVTLMIAIVWLLPFAYLEKIFGMLGLCMIIFIAAAFSLHLNLEKVALGFLPTLPKYNTQSIFTYVYFAIGILVSCMMPYEIYFYSSGGVEEKWKPKDLLNNTLTTTIGMSLGAIVAIALLILGAGILKPLNITPQLHGTAATLPAVPFGKWGLIISLLGIIFTLIGAAIETCLSGAYNICQYFNWSWGRHRKPLDTPQFTLIWMLIFTFALFVLLFQIDPVELVEYAVIFSVIALPFTYYSILKTASDKKLMKSHAIGGIKKVCSWGYLVLIIIISLLAIPLMIVTNIGSG